jgi:hypothetical protein
MTIILAHGKTNLTGACLLQPGHPPDIVIVPAKFGPLIADNTIRKGVEWFLHPVDDQATTSHNAPLLVNIDHCTFRITVEIADDNLAAIWSPQEHNLVF